MITPRWPDLPVLGEVGLPRLAGGADETLWPGLLDVASHLPPDHVVIGGVMVYLHGMAAGIQPSRVTNDVDVLMNVEVAPTSLRDAVAALTSLDYRVDPECPENSTHRYRRTTGAVVDLLAPSGVRPPPDLTTTPPGRTITVPGGLMALANRVVIRTRYRGDGHDVVIPDLPRAVAIKCAAYRFHLNARPAEAYNSRHLQDLAFLAGLIDDPDDVLSALGGGEQFADIHALDDSRHPAWTSAGARAADARLAWDGLRRP